MCGSDNLHIMALELTGRGKRPFLPGALIYNHSQMLSLPREQYLHRPNGTCHTEGATRL